MKAPLCGDCGFYHPVAEDCGPDPDGTYPCQYGHMGCSDRLNGRCDGQTHWKDDYMNADDYHDLGLCPECERDLTAGQRHGFDCPLALVYSDGLDQDFDPATDPLRDQWAMPGTTGPATGGVTTYDLEPEDH